MLALILFLPIPFGNMLPALAICLFSLAILERDGFLRSLARLLRWPPPRRLDVLYAVIKSAIFIFRNALAI